MSADATTTVDEVVDSLADGDTIDWDQLEAVANEHVRRLLGHLKTISTVAEVHRTLGAGNDLTATTDQSDTDLVGLGRWGHLQLVRKVGEGSYGEVYHARDTWLDHPVALKLLRHDISGLVSPTKLLDEARVLVKVRHPNVVAVHGAARQDGRVGFWMEFVQGQRLDDLLALQGLFSAEDAAAIGQQLCGALAAVHGAGLVHRDVKLQNVMREPSGRVVLMDFGAGHLMGDTSQRGRAGTPMYLAPEVFRGAIASVQTDIYALGVLLYHLVTGAFPVEARTLGELEEAHAQGRRRSLHDARPGLPRAFVAVVERMLAPDPANRYATAADALNALRAFTAPASLARTVLVWAGRMAAALAVITALGLLTTATFNIVMGRTGGFSDESVLGWFRWGLSSLVAPLVYIAAAGVVLTLVVAAARLLCKVWSPACRAATDAQRAVHDLVAERGLDDPNLIAQAVTGAGTVALAGILLVFWQCLATVTVYINDAPASALAILNPERESTFDLYGLSLDLFLLGYGLALYRVLAWAKKSGRPLSQATRVSAFVVPVLALMMWEMPYRVAYQNAFTRMDLGSTRCYELGRNVSGVLLHCPDIAPPRNRIVSSSDATLHARGVVESVFLPSTRSHPTK